MNHFYVVQLPPPYGPNYAIINHYTDYYGKPAYSVYKVSAASVVFNVPTIEAALDAFANIPHPYIRHFYLEVTSLKDFGIDIADLEPVYDINLHNPELFI